VSWGEQPASTTDRSTRRSFFVERGLSCLSAGYENFQIFERRFTSETERLAAASLMLK
jgi:hypothetical protein